MKLVTISSSQLPSIAASVKEWVNQGKWILFTSPTRSREAETVYFLQTEQAIYELNRNGDAVHKRTGADARPDIDELLHFGDLPQPASLSNGAVPAFSSTSSLLAA
ncbi:hypothetical protein D3C87_897710 [compost metagenome]